MAEDKILTHTNLKGFRQHGFSPRQKSGTNQAVGNCIFCGREDKFFINVDKKTWDCKVCSKKGAFPGFLLEVLSQAQESITPQQRRKLAQEKGLESRTIKEAGIGYNPVIRAFILPVFGGDGKLHDLKIYKGKKLLMTSGSTATLYGADLFSGGALNVWLCEGEWDCLVMREALRKRKFKEEIAIAVPGANTFKKEWSGLFQGLNVNVLYDNDDAGKNGSVKVYNSIQPIVRTLNFLHWKTHETMGKDIRDLYIQLKNDAGRFLKRIKDRLKPDPQGAEKTDVKINNEDKQVFKFDGKKIPYKKVHEVYTKWLDLKTTDVIDVLFGSMIANRLGGDPIWLFLVGSSGSTKSELIMTFDDVKNVYHLSSLTPKTLISGATFAGGGDPSLIPRLNHRILTVKDFTTILNLPQKDRETIFGQLRDAYDGTAAKSYGNGMVRIYKSNFGIIAGVTHAIDIYAEGQTALGERFLRWRIHEPKTLSREREIIKRAISNTTHEDEMRESMKGIAKDALNYDYIKAGIPEVPLELENKIIKLGQWVAIMRGTIVRHNWTQDILHKPFRELGTRISKQLYKEALGIAMFRGKKIVSDHEYNNLKYIAYSTVSRNIVDIFRAMYKQKPDDVWVPSELSKAIRLPENTCTRIAEDLRMLGVLDMEGTTYSPKWKIRKTLLESTVETGIFN